MRPACGFVAVSGTQVFYLIDNGLWKKRKYARLLGD